jgi:hypothetical protein
MGEFTNNFDTPQNYWVFKVSDGHTFCCFLLKHEFEFLKNTTAPNLHATTMTGIWDKLTNKIYDINMFSLLHLGASRFNHNPKGIIAEHEIPLIKDEGFTGKKLDSQDKDGPILILGLHAPALFFSALRTLKE